MADNKLNPCQWSISEVSEKIKKEYNEEIAKKFEDQKINGKALILLAKEGSSEQYTACGLSTVGDQMQLKEYVAQLEVPLPRNGQRKKPILAQVKSLSKLNQRIYKAKRNAVSKAALEKWPGNNIPIFRNNKEANRELDTLVSSLEESCTFAPAAFDKEGIKQHLLDVLNERRRRIRGGHDYTQEDKRKIKRPKGDVSSSETNSEQEVASIKESVSSETNSEIPNSDGGDTDIIPESDESETEQDPGLTLQSAKVIIAVMFAAIRFSDVTKQQLVSATKQFKSTKFDVSSKDKFSLELAKIFIEEKYVEIVGNSLKNVKRDEVKKLKVF